MLLILSQIQKKSYGSQLDVMLYIENDEIKIIKHFMGSFIACLV